MAQSRILLTKFFIRMNKCILAINKCQFKKFHQFFSIHHCFLFSLKVIIELSNFMYVFRMLKYQQNLLVLLISQIILHSSQNYPFWIISYIVPILNFPLPLCCAGDFISQISYLLLLKMYFLCLLQQHIYSKCISWFC